MGVDGPHRVTSVPADEFGAGDVPVASLSWSGFAPVGPAGDLFYWFFESSRASLMPQAHVLPLVVWLNGGPGSSSLLGLFMENGPFRLAGSPARVTPAAVPWNRGVHLLYWDQPVGTGFSTVQDGRYATDQQTVARDFCAALEQFYEAVGYSECPLFIAGESYAGKFIPNIAAEILDHHPNIPLQGVAIGDGWISPHVQARAQVAYAFELGFVDHRQRREVEAMLDRADRAFEAGDGALAYRLQNGVEQRILDCAGQPDIFDVRRWSAIEDADALTRYLNSAGFKSAVGVPPTATWSPATDDSPVAAALEADGMVDAAGVVGRLLSRIDVLIYSGNFDLSCGYAGAERLLSELDWHGRDAWNRLGRLIWTGDNGVTLGYVKQLDRLTQVVVPGAGHLAPADQPGTVRSMIENWIAGSAFVGRMPPDRDGTTQ